MGDGITPEHEVAVAHAALTTAGVPTEAGGRPLSLHLRIRWLLDQAALIGARA